MNKDFEIAQRRVNEWIAAGDVNTPLIFDTLYITSLPILPDTVRILRCTDCYLTSIPILPRGLLEFECNINQIRVLPEELPDTLKLLSCFGNRLYTLPTLPDTLEVLYCEDNRLPPIFYMTEDEGESAEQYFNGEIPRIPAFRHYVNRIRKLQHSRNFVRNTLTSHITQKKRRAFVNEEHLLKIPTNVKRHIAKYMNEKNFENIDLYPSNIKSNMNWNRRRKTQKRRR